MTELEPRVLLASDVGVAAEVVNIQSSDFAGVDSDFLPTHDASSISARQIVFVDAQVGHIETLLAGQANDVEIVLLRSDGDPLLQISSYLEHRTDVASLHFVAHGESGQVRLCGQVIDASILSENQSLIESWSNSLRPGADILLYSCGTGAGDAGAAFMLRLAELTGADIAASIDKTGNSQFGERANWVLERSVGSIESALAFSHESRVAFESTLAVAPKSKLPAVLADEVVADSVSMKTSGPLAANGGEPSTRVETVTIESLAVIAAIEIAPVAETVAFIEPTPTVVETSPGIAAPASIDPIFKISRLDSFCSTDLSLNANELSRIESQSKDSSSDSLSTDSASVIRVSPKALRPLDADDPRSSKTESSVREGSTAARTTSDSANSSQRAVRVKLATDTLTGKRISGDMTESPNASHDVTEEDLANSDEHSVVSESLDKASSAAFAIKSVRDNSTEAATAWAQKNLSDESSAQSVTGDEMDSVPNQYSQLAFSLANSDLANLSSVMVADQQPQRFEPTQDHTFREKRDLTNQQSVKALASTLIASANHTDDDASVRSVAMLYLIARPEANQSITVGFDNSLESSHYCLQLMVDLNNAVRQNEMESDSFTGTNYFDSISRPLSLQ